MDEALMLRECRFPLFFLCRLAGRAGGDDDHISKGIMFMQTLRHTNL